MMDDNPRSRRYILITAVIMLAVLLAVSTVRSARNSEAVFPATSATELSIIAGKTSVFVSTSNGNDIKARLSHADDLFVTHDGNRITIETGSMGILRIELPAEAIASLSVSTSSGDVDLSSVRAGSISISTSSGSMIITSLESDSLKAESASGSITLTETEAGITELSSASGSITAISTSGGISASTSSGNIYIVPDEESSVRALSASGNISIHSARGAVRWQTASGDARIFGLEMPSSGGTDNASIAVTTESGDISISA